MTSDVLALSATARIYIPPYVRVRNSNTEHVDGHWRTVRLDSIKEDVSGVVDRIKSKYGIECTTAFRQDIDPRGAISIEAALDELAQKFPEEVKSVRSLGLRTYPNHDYSVAEYFDGGDIKFSRRWWKRGQFRNLSLVTGSNGGMANTPEAVVFHEFGHHLDWLTTGGKAREVFGKTGTRTSAADLLQAGVDARGVGRDHISAALHDYATVNSWELFAEAFTAYMLHDRFIRATHGSEDLKALGLQDRVDLAKKAVSIYRQLKAGKKLKDLNLSTPQEQLLSLVVGRSALDLGLSTRIYVPPYIRVNEYGNVEHVDGYWREVATADAPSKAAILTGVRTRLEEKYGIELDGEYHDSDGLRQDHWLDATSEDVQTVEEVLDNVAKLYPNQVRTLRSISVVARNDSTAIGEYFESTKGIVIDAEWLNRPKARQKSLASFKQTLDDTGVAINVSAGTFEGILYHELSHHLDFEEGWEQVPVADILGPGWKDDPSVLELGKISGLVAKKFSASDKATTGAWQSRKDDIEEFFAS